jgi:hypothetical protein
MKRDASGERKIVSLHMIVPRPTLALVGAVLTTSIAFGKPSPAPPANAASHAPAPATRAWARPAPPLPMLPSLSRVRVEAARDHVTVVEDVTLPRGDWQSGGLDPYVAFGAPGTPVAVDARLVAIAQGATEPAADDAGEALSLEAAVRHTASTQLLIGPPQMAGFVVHLREADLRRAFAASDVACLRLRTLLAPPAAGADGERGVVVRLGIAGGLPLTLGRLQVVSLEPAPWITRAEAMLCGPEAEPRPLALALWPKSASQSSRAPVSEPRIAPPMAVRHASDDLCVRWWAAP